MKQLCFLCFILMASVLSAQQVTDTHINPVVKLVNCLEIDDKLEHSMSGMSFSQDGKYIYTGGGWEDGRLFRWPYPIVKGQPGEELFDANARMAALNNIVNSPDGKLVAVVGSALYVFTKTSNHKVRRYTTSKCAFSSDGQTLLAVSSGCLIAWEIKSAQFNEKYDVSYEGCSDLRSLCLSVDNQYVYIGERNGAIIQARFSDGQEVNRFKEHSYIIRDLVCTKNLLVSASDDAKVLFWKIDPEEQSLTLMKTYYPNGDENNALLDWSYEDIEISPNGQLVAFVSMATLKEEETTTVDERYVSRIVFWSLESNMLVHEIVTSEAHDADLSFHPREPILAVKGKGIILFFDYSGLLEK